MIQIFLRLFEGGGGGGGGRSAIGRAPDLLVGGPGFDTRFGSILSFFLPLFQDRQLSVTGENMCMNYWVTP